MEIVKSERISKLILLNKFKYSGKRQRNDGFTKWVITDCLDCDI